MLVFHTDIQCVTQALTVRESPRLRPGQDETHLRTCAVILTSILRLQSGTGRVAGSHFESKEKWLL